MLCRGAVSLRTLYIDATQGRDPRRCRVFEVSPFLRALILEVVEFNPNYDVDGREGRIVALMLEEIDRIKGEPWFPHAFLQTDARAIGRWPDMDLDPEPIFAGVRVPTLLFYGEDDEWSPIDASIATWRRAAERAGNRDVTIVRLAGTGHEPTVGATGRIEDITPEYERTLVAWLRRTMRLS